MNNRFDLPPPAGTCYLTFDPLDAIVEVLGQDIVDRVVPSSFFHTRRMWRLNPPGTLHVGDVTAPAAFAFGITSEISTLVPCNIPQQWAAAINSSGFDGIYFDVRHSPAVAHALALFGGGGLRDGWSNGTALKLDLRLISRLQAKFGVEVLPVPSSKELRIIDI